MDIKVDPGSPLPPYQQVVLTLKLQILSKKIQAGERLPPIRELAKYLKINPNTVARAYAALEEEGFLESRVGSGSWARLPKGKTNSLRLPLLESECRSFLERVGSLGFSRYEIERTIRRLAHDE